MSVLIKDMEMPKDKAVAVVIHPDGTAYTAEMSAGVCTKYLADCKAVPVPPHGRLIDKDVMCNECRRIAEEYDGIYPDCTYCPAHLAPTIIPAEPAEEGE